jgi:hypothetical protein
MEGKCPEDDGVLRKTQDLLDILEILSIKTNK